MAAPTSPRNLLELPNSNKDIITLNQFSIESLNMRPKSLHPSMPARIRNRLYRPKKVHRATATTTAPLDSTDDPEAANPWSHTSPWSINWDNGAFAPSATQALQTESYNTLAISENSWDTVLDDPNKLEWKAPGDLGPPRDATATALVSSALPPQAQLTAPSTPNSASPVKFEFANLPMELQLYFMRYWLTSPNGILNPWQNGRVQVENGVESSVSPAWAKFLRPSILAVNPFFNTIGVPMLYGNPFHFTRTSSGGRELENDPAEITNFLSYRHLLRDPLALPGETIGRGRLIKHVILEDKEYVNDGLVANALSRYAWQFHSLRRLEWLGCNLTTLTITLDEAFSLLLNHLEYETSIRKLGNPGCYMFKFPPNELDERSTKWGKLLAEHANEDSSEPWPLPADAPILAGQGVHTSKLYVNGMSSNGSGLRKLYINGRSVASSPIALQVMEWLGNTGIFPAAVEFMGPSIKHLAPSGVPFKSAVPGSTDPSKGVGHLPQASLV